MASFSISDKGASPAQETAPGDGQGIQGSDTLKGNVFFPSYENETWEREKGPWA